MSVEAVPEFGKALRHHWGPPISIHASMTSSNCEQTERVCTACGLTKITVHPPKGIPWREWRHPSSENQFAMPQTPPCYGGKTA